MIVFISTRTHQYTHSRVVADCPPFHQMSYFKLLTYRRLPRATYIFSDFDRLSFWQLELAAHVFRQLRDAGCKTLNDPARSLQRLSLLRRLHACGINKFNAWPASEWRDVDKFPVFIRTISAHRGNLTDLIDDADTLSSKLNAALEHGYPLHDLMIAQYCAEPLKEDVFRKLSTYRIGDTFIATPSVHERHWSAKYGENGAAGEAGYADDLDIVRTNRHEDVLRKAFTEADIDYGRADFGIVDGEPQIYEINTNPTVSPDSNHPFADRNEAYRVSHERYLEALENLDDTVSGTVRVNRPEQFTASKKHQRLFPGYQWTP